MKKHNSKAQIAASLFLIAAASITSFSGLQARAYNNGEITRQLAPKLAAKQVQEGAPLFIRIFKRSAELELWLQDKTGQWKLFQNYPICYFSGLLGPKLKEGDGQSPEGFYSVSKSQMNPNSSYHLSFNLGFPNKFDRANGRTGSYLMVHGNCVSIGCYAMTDEKIEEIYTLASAAFKHGQQKFQVHVFPFRMTEQNMTLYATSGWMEFWNTLKRGYDVFEQKKTVPDITVSGKNYIISEKAVSDLNKL